MCRFSVTLQQSTPVGSIHTADPMSPAREDDRKRHPTQPNKVTFPFPVSLRLRTRGFVRAGGKRMRKRERDIPRNSVDSNGILCINKGER